MEHCKQSTSTFDKTSIHCHEAVPQQKDVQLQQGLYNDSTIIGSYSTLAVVTFFLIASLFLVPSNFNDYQNLNKPDWDPGVALLLTVWLLFFIVLTWIAWKDHKVTDNKQCIFNANIALGIVLFSVLFYAFAVHEMQNFALAAGFIGLAILGLLWWFFSVGLKNVLLLILGVLALIWLIVILVHAWRLQELN